jgi:hypothetical protein
MLVFSLFHFSSFARADCIDWNGLISESHPILTQTKHAFLAVEETISLSVGERECIDVNTCVWSLSNDIGSLERDEGTENTYTAPLGLTNCETQITEIMLDCTDDSGENFSDQAEITIACSDEIDDDNPSYWTASGGGCNSPSYAILFPFLLVLHRKRRRED